MTRPSRGYFTTCGSQLTQRLAQSTIVNVSTMNAMLRSSLRLSARHRVTYYMGVESAVPGKGMSGAATAKMVIPKGLWEYRPTEVRLATLERRDGGYRVQAEFPVKVSHYNISKPSYLGVGVQDEIRIKIALTAVPANTVASK